MVLFLAEDQAKDAGAQLSTASLFSLCRMKFSGLPCQEVMPYLNFSLESHC